MYRFLSALCVFSILMACAVQQTVPITTIDPAREESDVISALAGRISRPFSHERRIIAVLPFFDLNKRVTNLGRAVSVELQSALIRQGSSFMIVERDLLKQTVHNELLFMASGMVDEKTTVKLGRIYGADTLVVGHVYDTGDYFKMVVKVLDTSTARVMGMEDALLSRTTERLRQNGHVVWRFQ